MSKKLYILQGISGSGKTTLARKIKQAALKELEMLEDERGVLGLNSLVPHVRIFSTDGYWGEPYDYDPSRISEAHMWNQRRTTEHLVRVWNLNRQFSTIIIDNTNTTRQEARPYAILAKMFEHEIKYMRVSVSPEVAKERQLDRPPDRRIPDKVIDRQYGRLEKLGE